VTASPSDDLARRFRRVLDHVDGHLEEDLTLERLSAIAAYSKFHFLRQFRATFGVGVHQYVSLVRLKRAAYELAYRPGSRILDVAIACGYESHDAFGRAFKKVLGQTPSEFRAHPRWAEWHAAYAPVERMRSQHMKPEPRPEAVTIVTFPATRVAMLPHRGDPSRLGDSIRAFIEFRRAHGLHPRESATFNVLHDDPRDAPPDAFRLDLCAAIDGPVPDNRFGVVEATLPGGRCAVLRHVGSDDALGDSLAYLYATWLPASGEEPRDFPPFAQRILFFPDVPEHEAVTDLFLPLR
jgi:AraC family transcriptional regulator